MRIALDARWIFDEISGIGTYTKELIRVLARMDRENDYLLLFDRAHIRDRTEQFTHFNAAPNFQAKLVPYGVFSARNQYAMPRFLGEHGVRLYHSPNYMIPLRAFPRNRAGQIRCVTTIHDVIPLVVPNHAPRSKKARLFPIYARIMKEVGKRSDIILTVSDASREGLIKALGIPEKERENVITIPNGVNGDYRPLPGPRGMGPQQILYVGRLDPYKNVVPLIESFARLRQKGIDARLRIIGPPDPRYPEPQAKAIELGVNDDIHWSGYVQDEQLKRAYQAADVFVLPSRYEGFGLPVLEAMACGTPVICSNASSLPEVAGDAGILVEPGSAEALAEALVRVLTHPGLAEDLKASGLKRVKAFTWENTAEKTLEAYGRAAAL